MILSAALGPETIEARMDRMYRPQTLIYDLTRKYYLRGRDRLIESLGARPGETVLEIGCGTGRNLVLLGRHYPGVQLLGIDAAAPMLAKATGTLRRHGIGARLGRGVAERLDLRAAVGVAGPVDHVLFSYTLSMVDDPVTAIEGAHGILRPGGTLHIVDFGDQNWLPSWFKSLLLAWLRRFHVSYRPEVEHMLRRLGAAGLGRYERDEIFGSYALLLSFTKIAPSDAA